MKTSQLKTNLELTSTLINYIIQDVFYDLDTSVKFKQGHKDLSCKLQKSVEELCPTHLAFSEKYYNNFYLFLTRQISFLLFFKNLNMKI